MDTFFAYNQWFRWPATCQMLTDFNEQEIDKTAFLGRSFASYNAAIGVGLLFSFLLAKEPMTWVQGVTLILIIGTAAVGASGTKGKTILKYRMVPALVAFSLLIVLQITEPANVPAS